MITIEQVLEVVNKLPDDGVNPVTMRENKPICVYTDPDDLDSHCIVGEILSRFDYALPDVNSSHNVEPLRRLDTVYSRDDFEPLAYHMLCEMQNIADSLTRDYQDQVDAWSFYEPEVDKPKPFAWGEAKSYAFDLYLADIGYLNFPEERF